MNSTGYIDSNGYFFSVSDDFEEILRNMKVTGSQFVEKEDKGIKRILDKIILSWSPYDTDRKPLPNLIRVKGMIIEVEDAEFEDVFSE